VKIPKPVNKVQHRFNELCDLGGGPYGGPARTRVQQLLFDAGKGLNEFAFEEINEHLQALNDRDPWKVCYAVGLSWGHLAKLELDFTDAASRVLYDWNQGDLNVAKTLHLERGPEPIEASLRGGYMLFEKVTLPRELPDSLSRLGRAQERWFSPILRRETRPRYIGPWNATAMFMVALFAQPDLAATLKNREVLLPPNGPVFVGLSRLNKVYFLSRSPSGGELDDGEFEPGVIYENNDLMTEILKDQSDWSLLDVHSALYLIGTKHPHSDQWVSL